MLLTNICRRSEYVCRVKVLALSCSLKNKYKKATITCLFYTLFFSSSQLTACLIGGECYEEGEFNPANPRQFCHPTLNSTDWQQANGMTLSDSLAMMMNMTFLVVFVFAFRPVCCSFDNNTIKNHTCIYMQACTHTHTHMHSLMVTQL